MWLKKLLGLGEHHYFFKDRWIRWALFCLAISQVMVWVVTGWVVKGATAYIALNATIYFGISLFGEATFLWQMPLWGAVVAVVNMVLAGRVYANHRWLSQFLLAGTILWQWLLVGAVWWIFLLNKT